MGLNLIRLQRGLTSCVANLHRSKFSTSSAVVQHSPTLRPQFQSRSLKSSSFPCAQLSHSSNNQNDDHIEARMAHLRRSLSATSALSSFAAAGAQPSLTHQFLSQSRAGLTDEIDAGSNAAKISADTMQFQGCDYNRWIVVMDFKEDDMPSPEEKLWIFEETCARGLNIR